MPKTKQKEKYNIYNQRGKSTMKITTISNYGTMPLEGKIRSIFDHDIAGQFDTEENYVCIHVDHKTHEKYALPKEISLKARELGYPLEEGKTATFNGERVRGMTFREEMQDNEGNLMVHTDIWGNIAVDEPFDVEWFMDHCI
jgi:hypothetical protein